ncbi:hypothetical protein HDE_01396 [Halotydeus destructor]|nr:hypothetical protein HDE_01396 [Halotydeus destructor]
MMRSEETLILLIAQSFTASASSSIADMALASLAAPVAAAAAEVASSVLASATGSSSPALTASSGGSSLALPPLPTLISIIQSAALTASSAMQAATPSRLSATAPGLSDRRRTMRLIARDAMTYLAAPLFMPTAFRRALQQPNGLPQDQAPIRRLGRFLIRRFRPQSQTTELNDNFADLLTKNRKNILLTMKQFRELTKHTSAITHKKRA